MHDLGSILTREEYKPISLETKPLTQTTMLLVLEVKSQIEWKDQSIRRSAIPQVKLYIHESYA